LHDESPSSAQKVWWDDQELGSALMDDTPSQVPLDSSLLADYVQHNAYDENDDEYLTDYIDLTLFAIVEYGTP
jgi:hypothetical protein